MGIANPDNCVAMATGQVRAAQALRDDLLAALFPHSGSAPSELLQSRVKLKLKLLTFGIERALLKSGPEQHQSWNTLSESGLLREGALVDFALSRIAEDKLQNALQSVVKSSALSQLPVILLGHSNERLAAIARTLLHAEHVAATDDAILYHRLDSELLHLLCWRVVAALLECKAADTDTLSNAANALLAEHHSRLNPLAIARKVVFFLGSEYRVSMRDPRSSGLLLFVAWMDRDYNLGCDFILRLIGGGHVAPLLLLLKGQETETHTALEIVIALRSAFGNSDMPDIRDAYLAIDPIEARVAIETWRENLPV